MSADELKLLPNCKLCGSPATESFHSSPGRVYVCCNKPDGKCRLTTCSFQEAEWIILNERSPTPAIPTPTEGREGWLTRQKVEHFLVELEAGNYQGLGPEAAIPLCRMALASLEQNTSIRLVEKHCADFSIGSIERVGKEIDQPSAFQTNGPPAGRHRFDIEQQREWADISTAPKDGRTVQLAVNDGHNLHAGHGHWVKERNWWAWDFIGAQPNYWQPKTSPPNRVEPQKDEEGVG